MGVNFVRGSTQGIRNTSSIVPSAFPITIGGWFRFRTSDANIHMGWAYGDGTNQYQMNKSTGNVISFDIPGVGNLATLANVFSAGVWLFIVARFIAAGNYRFSGSNSNGVFATATSANANTLTATTIALGTAQDGSTSPADLDVGEFWWANSDIEGVGTGNNLKKAQHFALAYEGPWMNSFSASVMQHWSFRHGYKAIGPHNVWSIGKTPVQRWTAASTPQVSEHPPVVYPSPYDGRPNNLLRRFMPKLAQIDIAAATGGMVNQLPLTGAS